MADHKIKPRHVTAAGEPVTSNSYIITRERTREKFFGDFDHFQFDESGRKICTDLEFSLIKTIRREYHRLLNRGIYRDSD